jgi:hypothetical protein
MEMLGRTREGSKHATDAIPGAPGLLQVKGDHIAAILLERIDRRLRRRVDIVSSIEVKVKTSRQRSEQVIASDLAASVGWIG